MTNPLGEKIIINTKNLTTTPLTWQRYSKMVENAIHFGIKDFLFTNDDLEYKFYCESRFKRIIELSAINTENYSSPQDYIQHTLRLHYLINPRFPERLESFYKSVGQESIDTIYVQHLPQQDLLEGALSTAYEYKETGKVQKVGMVFTSKVDAQTIEEVIIEKKLDAVILQDRALCFEAIPGFNTDIEINYDSELYNDAFLLINLLYLQKKILKTTLLENQKLMAELQQFLQEYSLESIMGKLEKQRVKHFIIHSDNDELLECMLDCTGNGLSDSLLKSLHDQIETIKQVSKESWWLK